MKGTKYIGIDKSILQEGRKFKFNIYISSNLKKEMNSFKKAQEVVTNDEMSIIDKKELLYIKETDNAAYKYLKEVLLRESKEIKVPKTISFNEKTSSMYNNATNILNNLFNNPEGLGNYEGSKEVVNSMVETILDDKFTIKSLMNIATHDYYTHTHSINVSIYALSLGSFLDLKVEELSALGEAALLHDLGKSKIDVDIINKSAELSDEEFKEVKKHPTLGYTLGLKLGIKNRNVLEGIRHHHEKMNGKGYPFGMRGKNIPYYARIIGICDIFDALTSTRSYKEAMTAFEALVLMKTKMNKEIDMTLLAAMIKMFR
ncbi:MAG: HD-GYP domain-containing protein (c-di-GMP phosphodiesterase class II) [Sulfurimonas sp.]